MLDGLRAECIVEGYQYHGISVAWLFDNLPLDTVLWEDTNELVVLWLCTQLYQPRRQLLALIQNLIYKLKTHRYITWIRTKVWHCVPVKTLQTRVVLLPLGTERLSKFRSKSFLVNSFLTDGQDIVLKRPYYVYYIYVTISWPQLPLQSENTRNLWSLDANNT